MAKISYEQATKFEQNIKPSKKYTEEIIELDKTISKILDRIAHLIEDKIEKESIENKQTITYITSQHEFPLKIDLWYKYKRREIKKTQLDKFYSICQYLNVSADYLLGFNDVPSKEASAEQIHKDYGLTYEALDKLHQIYERSNSVYNNKIGTEFINLLLISFSKQFLDSIFDYCAKLDEFNQFKKEKFFKGKVKKKYLSEEEQNIIDKYQALQHDVSHEKFILAEKVFEFADSFYEDFLVGEIYLNKKKR